MNDFMGAWIGYKMLKRVGMGILCADVYCGGHWGTIMAANLRDNPGEKEAIAEAWKSIYEQTKKNVDEILNVLNEKDITDQINAIEEQLNATLAESEI